MTGPKVIREVIFKLSDDIDYLSTRMFKHFTIEPESKAKMVLSARNLIKACWGDQRSLRLIIETMKESHAKDSLWHLLKSTNLLKDSAREVRFLKHCLWRLFEYHKDSQMRLQRSKKQAIRILMETILPFINKKKEFGGEGEQKKGHSKGAAKDDSLMAQALTVLIDECIESDPVTKKADGKLLELQKVIKSNPTGELLASKVGCTFRFTQMTKIHQPMFKCLVCNVEVCLICATLYHN